MHSSTLVLDVSRRGGIEGCTEAAEWCQNIRPCNASPVLLRLPGWQAGSRQLLEFAVQVSVRGTLLHA